MSQHSENDSDDDDCEYFLQPVNNQYNITEKIKEANQQLYKSEHLRRTTQPKVRFRDHKLVDFEPGGDSAKNGCGDADVMEKRSNSNRNKEEKDEEEDDSSDDGYIDDEILEISADERIVIEAIEIEEVCEQIEIIDMSGSDNNMTVNEATEETNYYEQDEFHKDDDDIENDEDDGEEKTETLDAKESTEKIKKERRKSSLDRALVTSTRKIFRSKINPGDGLAASVARRRSQKECCKYKETDEYKQKLPKYNGFNSHYGFSKDEIEKRESKQLQIARTRYRRQSQHIEQKEFLAKTNEEAFAKWLYKKMRNPINKSNPINMYDVKPNSVYLRQRNEDRKSRKQQQQLRQTIQRQMETDEYDDEEDVDDDDDDDVDYDEEVGEEEENVVSYNSVDKQNYEENDDDDDDNNEEEQEIE